MGCEEERKMKEGEKGDGEREREREREVQMWRRRGMRDVDPEVLIPQVKVRSGSVSGRHR